LSELVDGKNKTPDAAACSTLDSYYIKLIYTNNPLRSQLYTEFKHFFLRKDYAQTPATQVSTFQKQEITNKNTDETSFGILHQHTAGYESLNQAQFGREFNVSYKKEIPETQSELTEFR